MRLTSILAAEQETPTLKIRRSVWFEGEHITKLHTGHFKYKNGDDYCFTDKDILADDWTYVPKKIPADSIPKMPLEPLTTDTRSPTEEAVLAEVLRMFPGLKESFDSKDVTKRDNNEELVCYTFMECYDALRRQLPPQLVNEPLVIGGFLARISPTFGISMPLHVLIEAYKLGS